jgi:hypothetical protein
MKMNRRITRREFVQASATLAGTLAVGTGFCAQSGTKNRDQASAVMKVSDLPSGTAPAPLEFPHFPDRLHAFVWRNWQLVPAPRIARVVGTTEHEILRMGRAMGLSGPPRITANQQHRSFITVIKRNWHLLPYEQLLELLDWTPEHMAFTLREDDFLFTKLGGLKPKCPRLTFIPPDEQMRKHEQEIAHIVEKHFPKGVGGFDEALFQFVSDLAAKSQHSPAKVRADKKVFSPCFCYSYFALYGDPLLDQEADPYPEQYLAKLAATGVDGVWLQALLSKLAPFPWDNTLSSNYAERLKNLRSLVARARKHGIGIYLYLNEPRSMPLGFFETRPQMKGIVSGDRAALCTSNSDVQSYLVQSVESICRAVPDLAGFFTITASENMTNCWYASRTPDCPRCSKRSAAEVIAEVNGLFYEGIRKSGAHTKLIAWDWGWADNWAEGIINRLPPEIGFMSVSEWSIPIERGGVKSVVGEYSISTVGPGPRATRHWNLARKRGLKTFAKIQAGNTWELSATPYIPALENVAQHAVNLREANVDGLMLGWTLGGYPSPNLEVVSEISHEADISASQAMENVAQRRFGAKLGPCVVKAWRGFSKAFREFPFGTGLYFTPMQVGPSNLLWEKPTGFTSTMVGFPYDDLEGWRRSYPVDAFTRQFEKIADGFDAAIAELKRDTQKQKLSPSEQQAFSQELSVAEAAAIHFRSTLNQCRFVEARQTLSQAKTAGERQPIIKTLKEIIQNEMELARRLYAVQMRDSRIGFEASNQYYYIPMDLAEKVLNCEDLLSRLLA